ncbi:Cysteine-rich receptor-like protein kinase 10 [Zea mays]|uniref:Cysteine-rich receptor-like protein kinase 10 n=1 Tax=Zea mays TaxID=4577 RepID=A0A1D6IE39_MAIZE|nr:Cysteine-rich receptor-like protein kinase 10 [Zea mays]
MFTCRCAVVVVVALAVLLLPAAATQLVYCDDSTYADNSTFQANLNLLSAALPANASASPAGFATGAVGTAPEQVNGMALCRGDTNASSCSSCVAAAFRYAQAQQGCPLTKGATVYLDDCTLRFAGIRFLDFLREDQWLVPELVPAIEPASGSVNATDAWFGAAVAGIFTALVDRAAAASNATRKYFATAEMDFDPKLYGLAQCAPDLTPAQCQGCLGDLQSRVTAQFLSGRPLGNNAFMVWCSLRYSVSPFYAGRAMLQLPAPPAPPPTSTPTLHSSGLVYAGRKVNAAGISAGIACVVVLMLILSVFFFIRFRLRIKVKKNDHSLKKIGRAQCTIFDLLTLEEATEHFAEKNKLGKGGFGIVYKGILSDGQEIAVKKLLGRAGSGLDQLQNEVQVLAELQHKNLVGLQGFCSHHNDTLLVYEYIKNGSLDTILFDDREGNALNWEQHGYMAPEYASHGSVSPKIDIFSFGVLILEIVTRRSNCSSDDHSTVNLLSDVWDHWKKGTMPQMLHRSLDEFARSQALRCIHIGLLCVQPEPDDRPDISAVVFMLTRDSIELQPPGQPAFFFGRESPSALRLDGQSSYVYHRDGFKLGQGVSVNGVTLSELYPR